ncbi:MAG: TonB-dependent receptor [Betaproteobacteria bacterium]|nr:TonB-dependent receptor [Betaproteobacteria bacterium]
MAVRVFNGYFLQMNLLCIWDKARLAFAFGRSLLIFLRTCASTYGFFMCLFTGFSIHAQTRSLEPVVVSATRFETSAATLAQAVSVITAQDIQDAGLGTVNEAIMKILGVPGRQDFYGGGEYSLDLRGFTTVGGTNADPNQAIVVDGVRLMEGDLSSVRISGIPISSVERIEVLRGGSAVMYGEGATGGVIVITTKSGAGLQEQNGLNVSTAVGSDGLIKKQALATLVAGPLSLNLGSTRNQANNHRDNFNSNVESDQLTGQWRFQNTRVVGRYVRDDLRTGLPGPLTFAQYNANPRQVDSTYRNDLAKVANERSSVFVETVLHDWTVVMDVGRRLKSLLSTGSYLNQYDVDASSLAFRARHEGLLAGRPNALVVGVDQNDWKRVGIQGTTGTSTQKNMAFYAKNEVVLASLTRFSAGLRTENIQKKSSSADTQQTENVWDIGIFHPLNTQWSTYARVGQSFRQANLDELGYKPTGVSLQTQTSRDTEVGLRNNSGGWQLDARYFLSKLNNELGYAPYPDPTSTNSYNRNFDPTQRQGLEVESRIEVTTTFSLRANAALREARFTSGSFSGYVVPMAPAQTASLRANWKVSPVSSWDGGMTWVGSQYQDIANTCAMPGYSVGDIQYSREIHKKFRMSFAVNNLSDQKYYTYAAGCSSGSPSSIYPEAGRTFMATAQLQF